MKNAKKEFLFRQIDTIRVVGKQTPLSIYEPINTNQKSNTLDTDIKDEFETGFQHYLKQNWDLAAKSFNKVLKLKENDGPSKTFLERINYYKENVPAKNWDGVWSMTSK